jgi:hypothetical protein
MASPSKPSLARQPAGNGQPEPRSHGAGETSLDRCCVFPGDVLVTGRAVASLPLGAAVAVPRLANGRLVWCQARPGHDRTAAGAARRRVVRGRMYEIAGMTVMSRRTMTLIGAGGVLVAAAGVLNAPATRADTVDGCEYEAFTSYCDGPMRPDGTWERCRRTSAVIREVLVPSEPTCFIIDPAKPATMPPGEPPFHIGR